MATLSDPPPAPSPDADRTHRIIAAAHALLEEEGLEGLTIRAVLARTGFARRAIYERFPGKDDLILAVFSETMRLAADYFGERLRRIPDPVDRLELIVTGVVLGRSLRGEAAARGSRLAASMSREHLRLADARPAELQTALAPLIGLIAAQLAAGMAAGAVRQGSPERLAALVYNLVSTTVHKAAIEQEIAETDLAQQRRLATEVWDFCRRAIVA